MKKLYYHYDKILYYLILVYMLIMFISFWSYVVIPWRSYWLESSWLSFAHLIYGHSVFFFLVMTFIKLHYSDPGYLAYGYRPSYWRPEDERDLKIKDYIGKQGSTYCMKCDAIRPARAHHCNRCFRCVVLYDHHCPWAGNCVGILNKKIFLQFGFLLCLGLTHSVILALVRLHQILKPFLPILKRAAISDSPAIAFVLRESADITTSFYSVTFQCLITVLAVVVNVSVVILFLHQYRMAVLGINTIEWDTFANSDEWARFSWSNFDFKKVFYSDHSPLRWF